MSRDRDAIQADLTHTTALVALHRKHMAELAKSPLIEETARPIAATLRALRRQEKLERNLRYELRDATLR